MHDRSCSYPIFKFESAGDRINKHHTRIDTNRSRMKGKTLPVELIENTQFRLERLREPSDP